MPSVNVHASQPELAKLFCSVRLVGPPMGDEVVALVAHAFTPDEASVAIHIPFYRKKPVEMIAKKVGRPAEVIKPLLEAMSTRRVIAGGKRGYALLPLIPGMFEYVLMNGADTPWHREYARLLINLVSTGYFREYTKRSFPLVRSIPVQRPVEGQNRVLAPDDLSEMIDREERFSVLNVCQCRQSLHFVGRDCKRAAPEDGCLVFGSFAKNSVKKGNGRAVCREEMREIVAERQEKKLVFMTGNIPPAKSNVICTCCDCCCHFIQMFRHESGRMSLAPPPRHLAEDVERCTHCGLCTLVCNTHAHTLEEKVHLYREEACIGCGLCVDACKPGAITMTENPAFRPPPKNFWRMGLKVIPSMLVSVLQVKMNR